MSETKKYIAVLTGDLVGSSKMGEDQIALTFRALEDTANILSEWHNQSLRFTRHRGDGWQVALARPEYALRSALAFKATAKLVGSDTYIGGAAGRSPNGINKNLNDETAPVFMESGKALSWTKGHGNPFKIAFHPHGYKNAAFILSDHISSRWTKTQAEVIFPFLSPVRQPSYTEAGRSLGKSRQSVAKTVEAAGHPSIISALLSIEVAAS